MALNFEELPDDAEETFLYLERDFRRACEMDLKPLSTDNYEVTDICLRYMRKTLAAASECRIDGLLEFQVPPADEFVYDQYRDFIGIVDQCRTVLDIRHARRAKSYSVRFDPNTKTKYPILFRSCAIFSRSWKWMTESARPCSSGLRICNAKWTETEPSSTCLLRW